MAKDRQYYIGFDLGGTKMMAEVFDENFVIVGKSRKKTKAHQGVKVGLQKIISLIKIACEEADIPESALAGIGLGIPGPVDPSKGEVLSTANLGWGKVRFSEELKKHFDCPVAVANDVDAGVYGEYCKGAAKGFDSVLGVFPGTGIGGGFVINGEIFQGKTRTALEIGHIQMTSEGQLCGCGQRGCLETLASRLAIAAQAAKAAFIGEAPHLMEIAGADISNIRSKALAASINAGDKAVEQIVRNAAQWLGVGISNVINLLAPDVIVLGGGLVEAIPTIFREVVEEVANDNVMSIYQKTFKVVVAELGDHATSTGAALWAKKLQC